MKDYSDILHIVHDQFGLTDMAAYKAYCDTFVIPGQPRIPTAAERELLDPDTIDNRAFWEVAEFLFKTDPVSNCQFGQPYSKSTSNRNNLNLYRRDGFLSHLEILGQEQPKATILEIGPGYGAFRQWVDVNTRFVYHGIDVYPKIEEVDEAERTGLMGAVTKARRYDAVVACNVFQHLSINQRRAYYRDVAQTLNSDGWFMVSMWTDNLDKDHPARDEHGRFYIRHYGQFTPCQSRSEIVKDLSESYDPHSETMRPSGWIAITCRKKAVVDAIPQVG